MNNITQLKTEFFKRNGYKTSVFRPVNRLLPVNAMKFTDQDLIDSEVDNAIDVGLDLYKPNLKIVKDYIGVHNNYEDAIDNIHKIYSELDNENNAEYLLQILFASDLTGHLSFQSEINVEQSKEQALSFYRFQCKLDADMTKLLTLCFDKPPEQAIDFLKSKKVEINWNWREQEDAIKRHAFTVAKVSNADILQDIQDSLLRALEDGKPYADFKKDIQETLIDKGYSRKEDGSAWQLNNIYRTNLQSSFMAGRYQGQIEVAQDFPFWEYIAVMDSRTRDSHAAMNGTIRRYDDKIWSTWYPPSGFSCRCRIVVYNDRTLKRANKKITDVPDVKVDKGFESNPATAWKPDLTKLNPQIKDNVQKDLEFNPNSAEIETIRRYSEGKYGEINSILQKFPNDYIKNFKKNDLLNDVIVLRNTINKNGDLIDKVYRGLSFRFKKDFDQYLSGFKENDITVLKGFQSTTKDLNVAKVFSKDYDFNVMLEIQNVKKGLDISKVSTAPHEKEVLLDHQSKMKILKIEKTDKNNYTIKLEHEL